MAVNVRPDKPISWLIKDMRNTFIYNHKRALSSILTVFCVTYFAATFTFMKEMIPHINPFSWDVTFAGMDRAIHGGVDPYVLLAPFFGNPFMTKLADAAYSFWFVLIYFTLYVTCADTDNPDRRNTFLFSFLLTWILGGTILAILLSSVGPVYYQAFGYGEQFLPLMESLKGFNEVFSLTALEFQGMLLDGYQGNGDSHIKGISAMPSMHVAMSWIIAFHGLKIQKVLGWALVAFAILIQLSSVHLGWHYAIDGYLGFIVAIVCWIFAKRLAKLQNHYDQKQKVNA